MATGKKLKDYNPFSIITDELPPQLLLMAKMICLGLILRNYFNDLSQHHLPIIPVFDYMGTPENFELTLKALFIFSSILIFFNTRVRLGCFILGMVFLIVPLSSHASYSNAKLLCGCILFLISLHKKGDDPWLIRYQLAIMYLGAAINKVFDPHWQSGQYFEYWMEHIVERSRYVYLAGMLPELFLSKIFCWMTITTEFLLFALCAVKRWTCYALFIGVFFHFSAFIGARYDFGVFTVALMASYLSLFPWPQVIKQGFDKVKGKWIIEVDGKPYEGLLGKIVWLFLSPAFYFFLIVLICVPRGEFVWLKVRFAEGILLFLALSTFLFLKEKYIKNSPLGSDR